MGDTEPPACQLPGYPRGAPTEAGRPNDAAPDRCADAVPRDSDRHRVPANLCTEGRGGARHDSNSYPNAAAGNTDDQWFRPAGGPDRYLEQPASYTCRYMGGTTRYTHSNLGSIRGYAHDTQAYDRNRLVAGHG